MDGLKDRGDVVVIGATNRVEDVDPALRRPGRFDRELEIGVPNEDGRLEILGIHVRGMPLGHDVDLKKYARMTAGYSGADLAALCREAAFNAIRRITPQALEEKKLIEEKINNIFVTDSDFLHAYRQIVPTALRELYFEIPKTTWNDIGGYEILKSKLKLNVVEAIENIEKFKKIGIEPPRGVLLYGPPGCGKTLLAKALANEAKANLITIKGPEILSKWVGESEKAVREIFRKAKSSAPSIVLLDEVDSITKTRGSNQDSIESIVSQLITAIDSLQPEDLVFIIGTTNRPDLDIYFLKQALLKDLSLEPNIKAVSKSSDAQGYIEINVINYSVEPSSFDKNGIASRYRCTITVNLTLKTKDGKTPISNKALTSFEDFDASNDTNAIEISKQSVQKKVLANLALLIREELFINF